MPPPKPLDRYREGEDAYHLSGILVRHGSIEPFPGSSQLRLDFGHLGGVGMVLSSKEANQSAPINGVIPDSPAEKAGVRPGMVLLSIDGTATDGKTLVECAKLSRGQPGTKVTLELFDPAAQATNKVTVIRAIIRVPAGSVQKASP